MLKRLFSGRLTLYAAIASIVAFAAMLASGRSGPVATAQSAMQQVPIPGSTVLPPGGSATFYIPDQGPTLQLSPGGPLLFGPGAFARFTAASLSDQTTTVSYDGTTLTIQAPDGFGVVLVQPPNPGACPSQAEQSNIMQCAASFEGQGNSATFTTIPPDAVQHAAEVTYPAGWNLVGGPPGTPLTGTGPVYGYCNSFERPAPMDCEAFRSGSERLSGGDALWVYYPAETTVKLLPASFPSQPLTTYPGTYNLVGNPFTAPAVISGADAVYIYDATTGQYVQSTTIPAGQGAQVYSATGAAITITAAGS